MHPILTQRRRIKSVRLTQGMLVWTKDDGYQPIRWIGTRQMSKVELEEHAYVRPIRVKAGALGQNMPERDLTVSPQHRILVNSKLARGLHGADEVLVAAKHLLQVEGIDVVKDAESVTYVHFLFDRHQIVESEEAETESLFTGPEALKTVDSAARVEILQLFPELASIFMTVCLIQYAQFYRDFRDASSPTATRTTKSIWRSNVSRK